MATNSDSTPSPTRFSPLSSTLRILFALIKIWSVSEGNLSTRHDVP